MKRYLVVGFLILLGVSHIVRVAEPPIRGLKPGHQRVDIGRAEIALRDIPGDSPEAPVLVLLHGSPMASSCFNPLVDHLGGVYRLIIPDLPGFGGSTLDVDDYSIEAHAHDLSALLDKLDIESAHLAGYSMGGGVALEFHKAQPDRVKSLILLSSIGVQELELLGDYTLNHAIHGAQLAAIWALTNLTPHFGLLDKFILNVPYARNFHDTDQRPLREIIADVECPLLIVHGRSDMLVPYAAAREHARIAPHSELAALDGGHIVLMLKPEAVAAPLVEFIAKVETGRARERHQGTPERVAAAEQPFAYADYDAGLARRTVMLSALLGVATLVSEDVACITGGVLAASGVIGFLPAVLGCFLGIFFGDIGLYLVGRWLGRPALRYPPFKWMLDDEQLQSASEFFHGKTAHLVIATRFLPGTRLPAYFAAGMLHQPFWRFAGWLFIAAAIWTPILVGISMLAGQPILEFIRRFEKHALLAFTVFIVGLWILIRIASGFASHRGRRLMLSRWRRLIRWEFWPMWIVYPPVVLYLLWLGIRHRCMTLFTICNPAIPASGLALESKSEILEGLGGNANPAVARFSIAEADAEAPRRIQVLEQFLEDHGLDYPVVLKPDIGERGMGVAIIHDRDQAIRYFETVPAKIIVQEYVDGLEFGILYYRHPGEESGSIFSLAEKRLISVTGDGERTLSELILDDDRAVCMARYFIKAHGAAAHDIPNDGERVRLTELGTHCRGALFVDAGQHLTPELEAELDSISKTYDGFFFGRYDVRAPTAADLEKGEGWRILELNGVSSEAAHIYDPKYSIFHAWRTLAKQWRIAIEIGKANRQKGVEPVSLFDLIRLIIRFNRSKSFEAPAQESR